MRYTADMTTGQVSLALTKARLSAGLSQAQVAERMGTSQPAVSRIESGRGAPSIDFIDRYACAVGRPIELRFGTRPREATLARTRSRRLNEALQDFTFDPWARQPSDAEARSLTRDGIARSR